MENTGVMKKRAAKHNKTMHFYAKSFIICALIIFFSYIEYAIPVSYVDEVTTIGTFLIVLLSIPKFTRRDTITMILIIVAVLIGLFGNVIYMLNPSAFSVMVDVLSQLKVPLAFFAVKYALNDKEKQQAINMLLPLAKIFVAVNAALAVVSQVVNTPFTGVERYGLRSYLFIYSFSHQYATVAFIALGVIICSTTISERSRRIFTVFGLIAAVSTFKSFSLIFTVVYLYLSISLKRDNRFRIAYAIPLVVIIYFISTYQIDTYLTVENSPRRMFIDYAFVDAKDHFPLGSGFATYGSSEAAKHYSPLYYEYGFNTFYGMNRQSSAYLVDTYWPAVLGQLGWIGAAIFVIMYIRIFFNLGYSGETGKRKAFLYAMFAQYMVHALGAAILQSSTALLGFMALSLFTVVDEDKENKQNRVRLHLEV